jgi:RHS repeat-associated protein
MTQDSAERKATSENSTGAIASVNVPSIALPKGGGAIRGMGEKFAANPVTGSASMSVPIFTSPGRSGFGPQLSLSYDSGAGNGPFGFGWTLSIPAITRKTDKGLPKYQDIDGSDLFILSGVEDLVPVFAQDANGDWIDDAQGSIKFDEQERTVANKNYTVSRYRPRIEGLFERIERWSNRADPSDLFWRSISKENVTTWYGKTSESRIADPANPQRIFSWLLCESYDDKGNVLIYRYAAENDEGIDPTLANEHSRIRSANRYLKEIFYGNHEPYFPKLEANQLWPKPEEGKWYFEVVLDYGDRPEAIPPSQASDDWIARKDPFSTYRAGFEVRTHRLCQRVLIIHHIPDDPGPDDPNEEANPAAQKGYDGLVRSTDFTYEYEQDPQTMRAPIYSKLVSVTQKGYQRQSNGDYLPRQLPPVEFTYRDATIQSEVRTLDQDKFGNLPIGIDGASYQWIDLDGEGLSGVLTEEGNGWFYRRNLSPINVLLNDGPVHLKAKFAPLEVVSPKPAPALADQAQFLDLAGDGRPDLVQFSGPAPGFYERTVDERWDAFVPFASLPNWNWQDPNLKFIDLDGDGHTDILISEQDAFTWCRSLGEDGFAAPQRLSKPWDEESGPHIVFADGDEAIFLADMSGDGLTDIVRIRNGELCYWPNLGYGRLGAKITMDNAPLFDHSDQFDHQRLRLTDIDGTGTTDILYLHRDGVRIYFNQSGNSWSKATTLQHFAAIDNISQIQTLDLLGNGTAALVWSSPLPGDAHAPLRYIDLMGSTKPHLLVKMVNNLGAETAIEYAPSTKFYLQDKQAGKPWITRLPFPVYCVEKVTIHDKWRQSTFATTYSCHHGYFDGPEREFRGFGRVEQVDVEDYGIFAASNANSPYITGDQKLYQPPVKTVTWYHTGAALDREQIIGQFKHEYFPHWLKDTQLEGNFSELKLPEPELDAITLSADGWREALRACKGTALRQEVMELDVDALAAGYHKPVKLFSVELHNSQIERLQPRARNQHAVFHVTENEAITYHHELDLRQTTLRPDPRIAHTLNLRRDKYGNIEQAISVVYARRGEFGNDTLQNVTLQDDAKELIHALQRQQHLSYLETHYTNDVPKPDDDDVDNYRLRLAYEVLTYELTGIVPKAAYFTLRELRAIALSNTLPQNGAPVAEIPYQQLPDPDTPAIPEKRLVEHARSLFFAPGLDSPLPLGEVNALALPYEGYKLALTDEILTLVFDEKFTATVQNTLSNQSAGGYLSGNALSERFGSAATPGQYWLCAGVAGFNADAAQHFYLPERYTDPFGNVALLEYDWRDLFIKASTDALGNRTAVKDFDFRVLAARAIADINDNLSEVTFDGLGLPIAMAVKGKGSEGDNLTGFITAQANPAAAELAAFFNQPDLDEAQARSWLGDATSRFLYYFGDILVNDTPVWGMHPSCACSLVREQHTAQQAANVESQPQAAFEYSDGMGSLLVKKIQAEPASDGQPLRWVASGKTILNNKGKAVKQYEPYFSAPAVGHRYEEPAEIGVTSVLYYDAAGRLIRTESPDGSFSRVDFSPWHVQSYDRNDTVQESKWYTDRNPPDPDQPLPHHPITGALLITQEQRAAWLAAQHHDTPSLTILDSLGREVIAITHNRVGNSGPWVDEKTVTFIKLDSEGKPLWVQDARGNRVMQYIMPPLSPSAHPFDDDANLNPQGFVPAYDIAGNLLFQHSMDAGARWTLNDAAGKPIFAWDSRDYMRRFTYDELRRPTKLYISGNGFDNRLAEKTVYGDDPQEGPPDPKQSNYRGKIYQLRDGAGVVTSELYDFKGNLLHSRRQLLEKYKDPVDWAQQPPPALENESFSSRTRYDALNRTIQIVAPHSDKPNTKFNVIQPGYNEANLLERVDGWPSQDTEPGDDELLESTTTNFHPVTNIDYNAKGQRTRIEYGNGAATLYDYEEETFRLARLQTARPAGLNGLASQLFMDATSLQDLHYTYDPVGNITAIVDNALPTIVFDNQQVAPLSLYRYDALYRLTEAQGREHVGQTIYHPQNNIARQNYRDYPFANGPSANDPQAFRNYTEQYDYDAVGNLLKMIHAVGSSGSWALRYDYEATSNRLRCTSLPGEADDVPLPERYTYDPHGSMTSMPHLPLMQSDDKDQLQATSNQVVSNGGTPEITYYVYDASGERVRKVTERQAAAGQTPTRMKERIYLGGFEIYREYDGNGNTVTLERETLHVMDDKERIALVETRTDTPAPEQLIRYQFGSHLGSTTLEVDEVGKIISYEEYYPYGSTSYQAVRSGVEVNSKRFRYTGKERDDETGFTYHRARYYAPWLGRWTSADPAGMVDGPNLYSYVVNNPTRLTDPTGRQCKLDAQELVCLPEEEIQTPCDLPKQEAAATPTQEEEQATARRMYAPDAVPSPAPEATAATPTTTQEQTAVPVPDHSWTDEQGLFIDGRVVPNFFKHANQELWATWSREQGANAAVSFLPVLAASGAIMLPQAINDIPNILTMVTHGLYEWDNGNFSGATEAFVDAAGAAGMAGELGSFKLGSGIQASRGESGSALRGRPAIDPALRAEVELALAEATESTTSLYHGGVLEGGKIQSGRALSLTTDPLYAARFAEASGGEVYAFEIPTARLNEIKRMKGVQTIQDSIRGTSVSAEELRVSSGALGHEKLAEELMKYRRSQ